MGRNHCDIYPYNSNVPGASIIVHIRLINDTERLRLQSAVNLPAQPA